MADPETPLKNVGTYVFESTPLQTNEISSNIRISNVSNLKDFRVFYQVPWEIYKDNKYWVPPFWKDFRDFFTGCTRWVKESYPNIHGESEEFTYRRNIKGADVFLRTIETYGKRGNCF